MAIPLKDDFKPNVPIASQLTAEWCNTVAAFINYLEGAGTIIIQKPAKPSRATPVRIIGGTAASSPST